MRYSTAISAMLMACVVAAAPANLEERDYWVTELHTVTVVETETAAVTATHGDYGSYNRPSKKPKGHGRKHKGYYAKPKSTTCTEGYASPTPTAIADEEHGRGDEYEQPTYVQPTYTYTKPKYTPPAKPTTTKSTTKPKPTPAPSTGDSFSDECLETHNNYRAKHSASALKWNDQMASWASNVCGSCVFEHSGGAYGENLAAGYSSPKEAIKAWYDEGSMYSYANGDFSSATGHFTQIVWAAAKEVGCGVCDCNGSNGTPGKYFVCEYDTGNVIGQFQENVLPAN